MSFGDRVPWSVAANLAMRLSAELSEHVDRVKTAGSIRRRKAMIGDVELVAEPRLVPGDLLGTPMPEMHHVRAVVESWGRVVKEGPRYIKVHHREGLPVDLFLVHPPAQWGSILAIRTGPAELGRRLMAKLIGRGYRHRDGGVYDGDGNAVAVPDEETLFALAGMRYLPPPRRGELVVER